MQLAGPAKNAFTYQILSTAKDALANSPNVNVRDMRALESVGRVRLLSGGPPPSGPADEDEVGIQKWQTVLYAAGPDPCPALDFIRLVLDYKLQTGALDTMPPLVAHLPDGGFQGPLKGAWQLVASVDCNLPKPFAAYPPRGRRHVLAQLERKEEHGETKYLFSVHGAIYVFRSRFDDLQVPVMEVQLSETVKVYVRVVEFSSLEDGEALLLSILEGALLRIPVYFMNKTRQEDDEVAAWILGQAGVTPGAVPEETEL